MLGYRCDRCGTFEKGRDSQREGMYPPEGWATVHGLGGSTHLCAKCADEARALLRGEA